MQSTSSPPNHQVVKDWLKFYRETNIQRINDTIAPQNTSQAFLIEGLDGAVQAFSNAIEEREKKTEKLLRLGDKLRNAASECNHDALKNKLALLSFCLSKGFSEVHLVQGCSLVKGVVEIDEHALPLHQKLLDFMDSFGLNFRVAGSQEQFSPELFRNYIHFSPSKECYQPKEQYWNGLTLTISDVSRQILDGFCQKLQKKAHKENPSTPFLQVNARRLLPHLMLMTSCPCLNLWLGSVQKLLEKSACHPFLLRRISEGKIVIGLNDFPIPQAACELMRRLNLLVKVEGSEECFAANVFAQLAEKFIHVSDFHPRNYCWGNADISVSRALLSLTPFYESLQAMNSRGVQIEEASNFGSLEGLKETLTYLATRDPEVIRDLGNVYLFSQAYCMAEVKEECARQLCLLTSENPQATWALSHYLSHIAIEEDSFTRIMDKGYALSSEDFPLGEELISAIETGDSAFIVFEGSDLFFAKKAFLELVKQAVERGQNLSFKDFLPHPDFEWLASIQEEQIGGQGVIHSKDFKYNLEVIKALVSYLRTGDVENLTELKKIDWYSFTQRFNRASEALALALGCKNEGFDIRWAVSSKIRKEIENWLIKETPGLSLAKKLQTIKKEQRKVIGDLFLSKDGLHCTLRPDSEGTWSVHFNQFYFPKEQTRILDLEGIPFSWLYCHRGMNDAVLKKLSGQSTTSLFLIDSEITLEGMRHIATLPLKTLKIQTTSLNDEWLEFIPKTVKDLSLQGGKLTLKGLQKISHLPLKKLALESMSLEDDALVALKGMPLNELSISYCRDIRGSGLKHLQSSWLIKANLGYTKVDDQGVAHLAHMPLAEIDLPHTAITDRALDVLAKMPLEKLHLTNNNITDVGVEQLLKKKLTYIYLDNTQVTEDLKRRFSALGIKSYLSKKARPKSLEKEASSSQEKDIEQRDLSVQGEKSAKDNVSKTDEEESVEEETLVKEEQKDVEEEAHLSDSKKGVQEGSLFQDEEAEVESEAKNSAENGIDQGTSLDVDEGVEYNQLRLQRDRRKERNKRRRDKMIHPSSRSRHQASFGTPSPPSQTTNDVLLYGTAFLATLLFIYVLKK